MPGKWVKGIHLENGKKPRYQLNGLGIAIFTWAAFLIASLRFELFKATIFYDHYGSLLTTSFIFVFLLATYLYITGRFSGRGQLSGNVISDFWNGVELTPRLLGLNLKWYALKFSLTAWILINISFLVKEFELHGEISVRSILYHVFSLIYSLDYYYNEAAMLTTWDIIAEKYGFMLIFGNFFWMLFAFSIQPFYLLYNREPISILATFLIILTFSIGYIIFRSSNSQKNEFKKNPNAIIWGVPAQTLGGKILISGWWGVLRKPNYLGDWLIAIAFSLPTGFNYVFAYFYPIYLITLNLHRGYRDHVKCAKKYGKLWEEYMKKVPYMYVPYIY